MNLYAQIDQDGICHTVSTVETEIVATYENIGQRYLGGGKWEEVEQGRPEPTPEEPYQPTNAEIAQQLSDLQANLEIAGVLI